MQKREVGVQIACKKGMPDFDHVHIGPAWLFTLFLKVVSFK